MITTKDKIKLKKPMGVFTNVDEVCDVVGINEEGIISFKFGPGHMGCMSHNELEKYFEVIPRKSWSEWATKERWITFFNGFRLFNRQSFKQPSELLRCNFSSFRFISGPFEFTIFKSFIK